MLQKKKNKQSNKTLDNESLLTYYSLATVVYTARERPVSPWHQMVPKAKLKLEFMEAEQCSFIYSVRCNEQKALTSAS